MEEEVLYQDYLETKEKIDAIMEKLGLQNRKHFKAWLNMQGMRIFECEQYELTHHNN